MLWPNAEVSAVHVPGNDEDDRDRQVVMGHIRQPQGLGLGMEPSQERENGGTGPLGGIKHMIRRVGVLGHRRPSGR